MSEKTKQIDVVRCGCGMLRVQSKFVSVVRRVQTLRVVTRVHVRIGVVTRGHACAEA